MRTFYVFPEDIRGNTAILRGREYHHAHRVLRKDRGDRVRLVDGIGNEFIATIKKVYEDRLELEIEEQRSGVGESSIHIAVAQGIIKRERMEYALEKATELGVKEIYPLIAERSVRIREDCPERWRLKIIEAMKQSGRTVLPELHNPITFDELLELKDKYELSIVLDPEGKNPLEISVPKRVLIAIGPEGGFSHSEIEMAKEKNFQIVRMGDRILRAETATCAILALLHYKCGEF